MSHEFKYYFVHLCGINIIAVYPIDIKMKTMFRAALDLIKWETKNKIYNI